MAVAQLVRASDCGSEGRGFESPQPPLNAVSCSAIRLPLGFSAAVKLIRLLLFDQRCSDSSGPCFTVGFARQLATNQLSMVTNLAYPGGWFQTVALARMLFRSAVSTASLANLLAKIGLYVSPRPYFSCENMGNLWRSCESSGAVDAQQLWSVGTGSVWPVLSRARTESSVSGNGKPNLTSGSIVEVYPTKCWHRRIATMKLRKGFDSMKTITLHARLQ